MANNAVLRSVASACLGIGLASGASAQSAGVAAVDRELANSIDFRSLDYSVCFDRSSCTVGTVTVVAERQIGDGADWGPARIYWDPIDGLGVMDGGQNDEIDFDERLRVSFSTPTSIQKVWLSDLFATENDHYGATGRDDTTETAGIQLIRSGVAAQTVSVQGRTELPLASFNTHVWPASLEDGDLLRRVVIQGTSISVQVPLINDAGRQVLFSLPIGSIDPEKRGIFEGVETVEIDLATILPAFNNAPINVAGSENARRLQELLSRPSELEALRVSATGQRSPGNWSNGEVATVLNGASGLDGLVLFSPFGSSNDFSVAGLVIVN